jgi:gas vesicle protein
MSAHNRHTKAYEEKIRAELQQAKAQLMELEARAKSDFAQAGTDLVKDVKARRHEIEEKLQEMKSTGDANAEQVKDDIEAKVAKMKSSLTELGVRLKRRKPRRRSC